MAELYGDKKLFHHAAGVGNMKMLKELVKKVNINSRDNFNFQRTPLHNAAMSGSVKTVKFLLDKGAQINAKD